MLSVIMSARNLDASCLPSIDSILTQDVDLELIIVVDVGGKINLNIEDSRVKIITIDRRSGSHHALTNIGFSHTKFDILTVHDSDDISEQGRFKLLLSEMHDEQVISSYVTVQEKNTSVIKEFTSNNFVKEANYYKKITIKTPAIHCATLMTRSLWETLGPYSTAINVRADSERMIKMGIYMLLNKSPFKIIKQPLYRYCINPQSVSQQNIAHFDMQKKKRRMIIKRHWSKIKNMSGHEFLSWWDERMGK